MMFISRYRGQCYEREGGGDFGLRFWETYLVAGPWGAVASCYLHE